MTDTAVKQSSRGSIDQAVETLATEAGTLREGILSLNDVLLGNSPTPDTGKATAIPVTPWLKDLENRIRSSLAVIREARDILGTIQAELS